ncbi:hypothetical protein [Algoriphagus sanaruensis]|uniref:hypothetical protein n=1 Tax=Algoriphagus sanaruensis TaxID=1727163 RepID=UPI002FF6B480
MPYSFDVVNHLADRISQFRGDRLFGTFGFEDLSNGLLQMKMFKAGQALINFFFEDFLSFLAHFSVQDTFQQLEAPTHIAALQLFFSGV